MRFARGLWQLLPAAWRERINELWFARWLRRQWYIRGIRAKLRSQLTLAHDISPAGDRATSRVLIPLLQFNHYQAFQILGLAKALELRGVAIKVVICDEVLDGCEIKNVHNLGSDPCLTCRLNGKGLLDLYGLDVVRLSQIVDDVRAAALREEAEQVIRRNPARHLVAGVDIVGMINDSVTRHFYGAAPESGTPELFAARVRYAYSALVGVEVARRLHQDWSPTAVISDMGVYCDWAPYANYYRLQGIPYHVVSMSPFGFHAVMLNFEELYTGTERFDRWVEQRPHAQLTPDEERELDAFLDKRFAGAGDVEKMFSFFDTGATSSVTGINRSVRNVFLFSNVFWDIGLNYEGALFPDVVTWVLESVDALANQPGVHLYVKPHPAEVYGSGVSRRTIADAIRERYPQLPSNVTIIPPELRITTYDLFPFIDLGVVYNGTLGLELMLKGIPTVAGGAAPYGGHGIATEPSSRAEYVNVLRGTTAPVIPDRDRVRLFAYFYFIKAQLPWNLTPRALADEFRGYTFRNLDELRPGRNAALDHLCDCILHPTETVVEAWDEGHAVRSGTAA